MGNQLLLFLRISSPEIAKRIFSVICDMKAGIIIKESSKTSILSGIAHSTLEGSNLFDESMECFK